MTFRAHDDRASDLASRASRVAWTREVGIALTAAALCLVLVSNLIDLARGKDQLEQLVTHQNATLKTAGKAEAQLDALARGVQQLSSGGNANATKIIGVLQANGVHIRP